jgi:hypothetical protein
MRCMAPHVSAITHITEDELRECLDPRRAWRLPAIRQRGKYRELIGIAEEVVERARRGLRAVAVFGRHNRSAAARKQLSAKTTSQP